MLGGGHDLDDLIERHADGGNVTPAGERQEGDVHVVAMSRLNEDDVADTFLIISGSQPTAQCDSQVSRLGFPWVGGVGDELTELIQRKGRIGDFHQSSTVYGLRQSE